MGSPPKVGHRFRAKVFCCIEDSCQNLDFYWSYEKRANALKADRTDSNQKLRGMRRLQSLRNPKKTCNTKIRHTRQLFCIFPRPALRISNFKAANWLDTLPIRPGGSLVVVPAIATERNTESAQVEGNSSDSTGLES